MSGSSGPDRPGPGPGGGGDDCSRLRLVRQIEAPIPGVADALSPGDILAVELRTGSVDIVVLVDASGQDAGSIIATGRLLECLRQGAPFEAGVMTVRGGAIQVEVRAPA
ncbi:MAG: hypothetical protein QOE05_1258 [Actinomycetota bacterium]|nr:hypothetical protein [Actinomycetota bacterium]